MRVLCLDIGEKRIGVAVSDPLDLTAQSVETIFSRGRAQDVERVQQLCRQYETDRVLCGLPLNMNGTEGFQAQRIRKFAAALAELGLQVRFQDERLTTQMARGVLLEADMRRSRRKEYIDRLAATYILQSFLDAGGWREAGDSRQDHTSQKPKPEGVWHMSENNGHELDMEREDIVELVDEDGVAVRFEHLMTLEHEGRIYICLAPIDPMEDVDEDELVILRIETDKDGVDAYVSIEDEGELNAVFAKYCEIAEADDEE